MTALSATDFSTVLSHCGIDLAAYQGDDITVRSPIDGGTLALLRALPQAEVQTAIDRAAEAFTQWRSVPQWLS